jgi:adenosylcobinamide kinase/adenosylcobinamide-phosphate guanylyltransferase
VDELEYQVAAHVGTGLPATGLPATGRPVSNTARRVLVLGGSRSGKSRYAEEYFGTGLPVTYVATAPDFPGDPEWADRVRQHRSRRPATWSTVETGDPARVLDSAADGAPILVDSVTTWLSRVMDDCACWDDELRRESAERLSAALDALAGAWANTGGLAVAVSDEVGSGIVPESVAVRRFRDVLGELNQRLAATSDEVWLVTAGIPLRLR